MSKKLPVAVALSLLLLICPLALAREVYVIDVEALGARLASECSSVAWEADTVFLNRGTTDAVVTLLGVSNGPRRPVATPTTITVRAGRATSIRQEVDIFWGPSSHDEIWMYRLDVPDDVTVNTELFPSADSETCGPGSNFVIQKFGKIELPTFEHLVAANERQTITGLTLGALESHINVAVFNAGAVPASAKIEIRRACDGLLIQQSTSSIPANTIQQFTNFSGAVTGSECPPPTFGPFGSNGLHNLAFATVTVDQPSLSCASIVVNTQPPTSGLQVMSAH